MQQSIPPSKEILYAKITERKREIEPERVGRESGCDHREMERC